MRARNPKTGEVLEWDGKVWRKAEPTERAELQPWHPSVVPGQAWQEYYWRQRRAAAGGRKSPLEDMSPDARHVDPPKYPD